METDLELTVDGITVGVESTGERLLLSVDSVRDAVQLARGYTDPGGQIHELLAVTDLTAEIRVRGRIVGVAGAGARPGVLSQLLDSEQVELRLSGVLGALGAAAISSLERMSSALP